MGNIPAVRAQVFNGENTTKLLIGLVKKWSAIESKYAMSMKRATQDSTLGDALSFSEQGKEKGLGAGLLLFKTSLLDASVQAQEFSNNLIDDIVANLHSGGNEISHRQHMLLEEIEDLKAVFSSAFNTYHKECQTMRKSLGQYNRIIQQEDSELATQKLQPSSSDSESSSSPSTSENRARRTSRSSSFGRFSLSKRLASSGGQSPPVSPSSKSSSAMFGGLARSASGFLGRMRSGSGFSSPEQKESRLQLIASEIFKAQERASVYRVALNGLKRRSRDRLKTALRGLQDCARQRLELLQSNLRKVCVYLSSRYANDQFEVQTLSNVLASIDADLDLSSFVERYGNTKIATLSAEESTLVGGSAHIDGDINCDRTSECVNSEQDTSSNGIENSNPTASDRGQQGESTCDNDYTSVRTNTVSFREAPISANLFELALLYDYNLPVLPEIPSDVVRIVQPKTVKHGVNSSEASMSIETIDFASFVSQSEQPEQERRNYKRAETPESSPKPLSPEIVSIVSSDTIHSVEDRFMAVLLKRLNASKETRKELPQPQILDEIHIQLSQGSREERAYTVDKVVEIFRRIQNSQYQVAHSAGLVSVGSHICLPKASFDIVKCIAGWTLECLTEVRRLSKLETLLKAFHVIAHSTSADLELQTASESGKETLVTLLSSLKGHPQMQDFRFWDRALSSCIKASRQTIGVSESIDIAIQEVNVTLGRLIPFAQHMREVGWPRERIRSLMRVYILTLPSYTDTWKTMIDFLDSDLDAIETSENSVDKDFVSAGSNNFKAEAYVIYGEGALGVDIEDFSKDASENQEMPYAAKIKYVREGGTMHQAGVRSGGTILSIEGKDFQGASFVEVLHFLKESSILRPFQVTLGYIHSGSRYAEEESSNNCDHDDESAKDRRTKITDGDIEPEGGRTDSGKEVE